MRDEACVAFLRWSLPRLGLRWSGYRKVRRLVAKRISRRLAELGLADLSAYRTVLENEPSEWAQLNAMCRIPISRLYRDRGVFDAIGQRFLPQAAAIATKAGRDAVRCWSAGCASGEEPYTLVLLWRFRVAPDWPSLGIAVIATDADEAMIQRAKAACYGRSSLKDLPVDWRERAFTRRGERFCLHPEFQRDVRFELQDVREAMPDGPFEMILCRNVVFTYFDDEQQRRSLERLQDRLVPGGFLVLGRHEALPDKAGSLARVAQDLPVYRHAP